MCNLFVMGHVNYCNIFYYYMYLFNVSIVYISLSHLYFPFIQRKCINGLTNAIIGTWRLGSYQTSFLAPNSGL